MIAEEVQAFISFQLRPKPAPPRHTYSFDELYKILGLLKRQGQPTESEVIESLFLRNRLAQDQINKYLGQMTKKATRRITKKMSLSEKHYKEVKL